MLNMDLGVFDNIVTDRVTFDYFIKSLGYEKAICEHVDEIYLHIDEIALDVIGDLDSISREEFQCDLAVKIYQLSDYDVEYTLWVTSKYRIWDEDIEGILVKVSQSFNLMNV